MQLKNMTPSQYAKLRMEIARENSPIPWSIIDIMTDALQSLLDADAASATAIAAHQRARKLVSDVRSGEILNTRNHGK